MTIVNVIVYLKLTQYYKSIILQFLEMEVGIHTLDDAHIFLGFPGGSEVKESAWNAGEPGSIPGSGRYP